MPEEVSKKSHSSRRRRMLPNKGFAGSAAPSVVAAHSSANARIDFLTGMGPGENARMV